MPKQPDRHVGHNVTNDFDRYREAIYILRIHINRDRLKRLLRLSQSICMDTTVKRFGIKNSKKIFKNHSIKICIHREIKEQNQLKFYRDQKETN